MVRKAIQFQVVLPLICFRQHASSCSILILNPLAHLPLTDTFSGSMDFFSQLQANSVSFDQPQHTQHQTYMTSPPSRLQQSPKKQTQSASSRQLPTPKVNATLPNFASNGHSSPFLSNGQPSFNPTMYNFFTSAGHGTQRFQAFLLTI